MTGEEFSDRWTPRAIEASCRRAHARYKRELENRYRAYFAEHPELAADDHDRMAADLPSALPSGWASLSELIPRRQLHRHHLSGGSSQILSLALLGSAATAGPSLSWLASVLDLRGSFASAAPTMAFEHRLDPAALGETPRQTDIDLLIDDHGFLVCIEAKLWEAGMGSCSCGKDDSAAAFVDEDEIEPTPPQERGACSQRVRKRAHYYDAAQQILGLPARTDHKPCPIAAGYQAIRNIAAARALANGRDAVFALFFDARNPYFVGEGDWPGWARVLADLSSGQDTVSVRTCSWQRLLGSGAVPGDVVDWTHEKHGLLPGGY
jgi:hypothetical protein